MICGERARASEFEQAVSIAQCQVILQDVQAARIAIMTTGTKDSESSSGKSGAARFGEDYDADSGPRQRGAYNSYAAGDEEIEAMRATLPQLLKLNRYEKRAYSRRWRAIRAFTSVQIRNRSPQLS
jgi:hypothetical protein